MSRRSASIVMEMNSARRLRSSARVNYSNSRSEFCRIPLPPPHSVSIVVGKQVMKVVVALAVRKDRHDAIVPRRVVIRIGLSTPHVRKRVDAKCRVMTDYEPQHAGQEERAQHITAGPAKQQRQAEVHCKCQREVVAMLPHHQPIALQIAHAAEIRLAARIITQHPADVREPETTARAVRVALWSVDMSMMHAVSGAPVQRAVLQRHGAK